MPYVFLDVLFHVDVVSILAIGPKNDIASKHND